MRLLIVSDAWHPQINGVVRTIEMTAAELRLRGHEVQVIGPDRFRTLPLPGYPEIRLALFPYRRFKRMIDAAPFDAIHIATEGPLGWAGRRWCLKRRKPFTTAYHTRFPEYIRRRAPMPLAWGYAMMRRFHRPSSAVMVATRTLADDLARRDFQNLRLWTRGVDTQQFRLVEDSDTELARPILLSVGRIAVEKNLRAFLDLKTHGTKMVVGDGPELAALRRDYPNVRFAGGLQGEALAAAYSAADVFVFSSQTDTFGLVLVEALACGIPIAAYPVAGPLDVLGPQDARTPVGALDEDLGRAIERCLALAIPPTRCRSFVLKHYSWQAATDQFLTIVADSAAP